MRQTPEKHFYKLYLEMTMAQQWQTFHSSNHGNKLHDFKHYMYMK